MTREKNIATWPEFAAARPNSARLWRPFTLHAGDAGPIFRAAFQSSLMT
jgi:hypothetical protein